MSNPTENLRTCRWDEIEDGIWVSACKPRSGEWYVAPGEELHEFCPHCGGRIESDEPMDWADEHVLHGRM
jgi:hypothetical protein